MPGHFDPPLQVEFDRQIFVTQFKGGVSRYFAELIHTFRQNPRLGIEAQVHAPFIVNEMDLSSKIGRRVPHPFPSRVTRRLAPHIAEALCKLSPSRVSDVQIRHYTQYSLKYWKDKPGVRNVCTVYDMIPEKFPKYFPEGNPHQAKEFFVHHCDLVICISRTTQNDLLECFPEIKAPTVVVPLGVSDAFMLRRPGTPRATHLPRERYALFVGNRAKYKDFHTVLAGLAQSKTGPNTLLAVGGGRITSTETKTLSEFRKRIKVVNVSLTDLELADAYRHADFYVSASLYEGFGLPTIEALVSGCPVILSDIPAHREVGGMQCQFFAPGKPDQLADAIDAVPEFRRPVIDLLREPKQFSPLSNLITMAVRTSQAYLSIQ